MGLFVMSATPLDKTVTAARFFDMVRALTMSLVNTVRVALAAAGQPNEPLTGGLGFRRTISRTEVGVFASFSAGLTKFSFPGGICGWSAPCPLAVAIKLTNTHTHTL